MKRMTITEASRHFRGLMHAAQQEPVVIERLGHPRIVVMSTQRYQQLTRFLQTMSSPNAAVGGSCNKRKEARTEMMTAFDGIKPAH